MLDPKVKKYLHRCYVYVCYVNDVTVYVGKGTNRRYLHCASGKSSNPQLNQALFRYGIDSFSIKFPYYNLSDSQSLKLERRVINSLIAEGYTLFNSDIKTLSSPSSDDIFGYLDLDIIPEWVTEEIK